MICLIKKSYFKKVFKRAGMLFLVFAMLITETVSFATITDKNGVNIPNWSTVYKDAEGYTELVSDTVHSGNNALHLVKTSPLDGNQKYINLYNLAPIEKGKTYVYGCWIKADKAIKINMYFTDSGMENLSALGHTWDWKKVEFKITAPHTNANQAIGFMCYGAAKDIWIDDVFVYEVDENGNYVGENRIANNPGFELSTAAAASSDTKTDESVIWRDKQINNAEDYLSVSSELPLFKRNIKIDGDLSDWNGADSVDFLRYFKMTNYKGECTITATLKTAYDDKYFYFLVEADDPVHCDTGMYYWSSDSLQFMLTSQEGVFGEEIGIQYITSGKPYCTNENIEFSTGRNGNITYYEVAVPWGTYIPEKPGEFWFNAALNNNDGNERIYCLELDDGITNSKNADKAKKMVPMSDGDKTLTYLTAQDKNPMLPDGELGPKLSIINLGEATTAEIDLSDGSAEKVNLAANSFLEKKFSVKKHNFGSNTLEVDVKFPQKTVAAKFDYVALPDAAAVEEYRDKYTQKITELREKAAKLNKSGITTDYEYIDLNMAERSVEVLARLQAQGDYDVVVYNINALEEILSKCETALAAYESGEKKSMAVPKLADGKVVMKGNSFYGKTVTNGVEEYRPVYLASMILGWENRDEMPVWSGFGFNAMPLWVSFGEVVGQAESPAVWKKQRGSVDYSDADIVVTDEESHSGKHSVKFVNRTPETPGYGTYIYQSVIPEPNTKYTLKFSAKGNLNGMQVRFGNTTVLSGTTDEWKDYTLSWTSGENPTLTDIVVRTGDITDGAYIDDIILCKEDSDANIIKNGEFEMYYKKWEDTEFGVDYSKIDEVCDALRRAEFYNIKIAVDMMIHDPNEYLYTLENAKDEGKAYGVFMKTNPTAPSVEKAVRIFYRAVLPKIKEYDSLAVIDTHNEPTFNTSDSTYYKPFYTQFLIDKYGTVEKLNEVYNSDYATFEEIEMPTVRDTSMYFYDWQVFNESVLTDYFKVVAEEMAALAPEVPYSAKYMAETSPTLAENTLKWGIDFEKIEPYVTIAGNDAFAYLGGTTIQTKLAWYDIQHSLNGTAVADWENHIIIDHKTINLDPRQYNWLITNIWQGAIHYIAADEVWLWGINDEKENGVFRNTTMQYRADCMSGIGKTMSDINRLSYEVDAFKNEAADVGLFYSHASRTLDTSHASAFYESYCNTLYNGYKPCIITESHISDLNNYKVFVVPEALHTSRKSIETVINYAKNGGRVILLGENTFKYDLNNIEHPRELIDELYSVSEVIPTGTQPGEKKTAIAAQLFEILGDRYDEVLKPSYSLIDADTGEKVKNTEWLAVESDGGVIVNMLNYEWGAAKKVKLVIGGKVLTGENLLSGDSVGEVPSLEPYTPTFVKYNK